MITESPPASTQPSTTREHALLPLRQMLLIRHFEEKSAELYTQQKIRGFLHLYIGEEGVAVDVMQALEPDDAVVATYRGMLEEFGPERIRDTPLSESGFVGTGIGRGDGWHAADREVMTCNFSLLPLDQVVNNAATWLHMSGGQFNCPLVIRMATGGGNSSPRSIRTALGWYAHIPGIKILTPATLEDARGMLWTALEDSDPVLIFENQTLYPMEGQLATGAGPVEIERARIRRAGRDVTIISYGASLWKSLDAARELAGEGIEAEVIDLRTLRPLDNTTFLESLARTHRSVNEGWRSGGISAEIGMRIMESAFYELEAPVERVCTSEVSIPYPKHLEDAALPQAATIVATVRRMLRHG